MRETGPYATAQRLRRHHKPTMAAWWAAEHAYSHPPGKERDFWLSVFDILKKADKKKIRHHPGSVRAAIKSWGRFGHIKRNPPKLDRVVVRYASRVYDDISKAIKSGRIPCDVVYESPVGSSSTRGEWQYFIQMGKRPIDLMVFWPSTQRADIFVPDDPKKPVRITVPGYRIPDRTLFLHEFTHYLQALRELMPGTDPGMSMADYLDQTHERDGYFVQMFVHEVEKKLKRGTVIKDPAKLVKKYFSSIGLWKVMKPQTQKHHIDRLTEFINHV